MYASGRFELLDYRNDIFKVNISTGAIVPIISSRWDDRRPSLSPDNSRIAFISDRTGDDEVWLFDQGSAKLRQVTTASSYHFDSRYSNIQWLNNNELLITVYQETKSVAMKITLN